MANHTKYIYSVVSYKGEPVAEGSAVDVAKVLGYTKEYVHKVATTTGRIDGGRFIVTRKKLYEY